MIVLALLFVLTAHVRFVVVVAVVVDDDDIVVVDIIIIVIIVIVVDDDDDDDDDDEDEFIHQIKQKMRMNAKKNYLEEGVLIYSKST